MDYLRLLGYYLQTGSSLSPSCWNANQLVLFTVSSVSVWILMAEEVWFYIACQSFETFRNDKNYNSFWSRWWCRQTWFTSSHNYIRIKTKPSLRRVRVMVEWKPGSYGIEETISIQTGRRGTDGEWAGLTSRWIKIWEGYLGSKEPQSHTRTLSPGSQCREDKSPQLLAVKTSGDWVSGGGCWSPKQFLLGNPHME